MNPQESIASGLGYELHNAWLDWLDYFCGIEVAEANSLTLAEWGEPDYEIAEALLAEWQAWRAAPIKVQP